MNERTDITFGKFMIVVIAVAIIILWYFGYVVYKDSKHEFKRYDLQDMGGGIYARYSQTVSNIPAQNYEIAIYQIGNTIYTARGNVDVKFTDESPYAEIKESEFVNETTVILYVPSNGICFDGVSSVY